MTTLTLAFRKFANVPEHTPFLLRHTYFEQVEFLPQRDVVNVRVTGNCDNYQTPFHLSCSVHHLVQQDTIHTHRRYCGNPQLTNSKHNLDADFLWYYRIFQKPFSYKSPPFQFSASLLCYTSSRCSSSSSSPPPPPPFLSKSLSFL